MIDAFLTLCEEAAIDWKKAVEGFAGETLYHWADRLLILRCMESSD